MTDQYGANLERILRDFERRLQKLETEARVKKRLQITFPKASSVSRLTMTVGSTDNAIIDVGGSFSQSTLNDNFRDLAAKINTITDELKISGQMNGP
ncbi:hypothetical protein [Nonomuraea sediminis]|uniref:hypothetical protein n=1 Tax=Nonomuraea sediminis TaxID=2835864 RepID=UPI001BDBEDBD|nr:hypothetical protein [Nonomuraea sediminis]